MGHPQKKPDVQAIMAQIREDIKSESSRKGVTTSVPVYKHTNGEDISQTPGKALLYSEELNYLNAHWYDWSAPAEITSHRKFIGTFIVRLKRLLVDVAWKYLLRDYFEREKQFQMRLVRHLNETARYVDARDKDIFWQLVQKVDHNIAEVVERMDRLFDILRLNAKNIDTDIDKRVLELESDRNVLSEIVEQIHEELYRLRDTSVWLQNQLRVASTIKPFETHRTGKERVGNVGSSDWADKDIKYPETALSVRRFRAPVLDRNLEVRQEEYSEIANYFNGATKTVIDLCCNQGEFVAELRDKGVPVFGVDADATAVAHCEEMDLPVCLCDPLSYLAQVPERSLGGIFAPHVLSYFNEEETETFFKLIREKLDTNGRLVLLAVNTDSLYTLGKSLSINQQPLKPIHPEVIKDFVNSSGLTLEVVRPWSLYTQSQQLKLIRELDTLPAYWQKVLTEINENTRQMNDLLFGHREVLFVVKNKLGS